LDTSVTISSGPFHWKERMPTSGRGGMTRALLPLTWIVAFVVLSL
jgi:hypothetical protein